MIAAFLALALMAEAPPPFPVLPVSPAPAPVVWNVTPTGEQVNAAYPAGARGASGGAFLRCKLVAGRLADCIATQEYPAGLGFAAAALSLASLYRADEPDRVTTTVRIDWLQPEYERAAAAVKTGDFSGLEVFKKGEVGYMRRPAGEDAGRFFPVEAAKANVSGQVVAHCFVGVDGWLRECQVQSETPPEMGFAEAAGRLVRLMRVQALSKDGRPTAGRLIEVPLAFMAPE